MATIANPADKGFDSSVAVIDRAQLALLREIQSEAAGRLILKGGMAMRTVVGSMRMTKDIDFDRDPRLALNSTKGRLRASLKTAAAAAGMRDANAEITKESETTVRARLTGRAAGDSAPLRFEVEVSGRAKELNRQYIRAVQVVTPSTYGMAPFFVEAYTVDMLAAMKVAAAMSDSRNAPRDIYDLHDLIAVGANPVALLAAQDPLLLQHIRSTAMAKLELVTFAHAREELRPYLPLSERDALTEERWLEYTLEVGEAIERWVDGALALRQGQQGDLASDEPPDQDAGPAVPRP
ncbi:nucleotidyl transferase AbiEii/AbiGii toxin family protein [Variovorax paradoxus]|nr:nucleotidyl transferase AbiEii/AbiGii toxin family protein [Variovorax paradoxus]MBT2305472.1 nucleotidyl transferase AbiEii/AbiGii toxin family protein [Variovorax paradoxus]